MKRLGLYGGSFDPVHHGHLLVALAACEELELDRLFFIPAARSPFKPDHSPAEATDRLRLLRLALAGHPAYVVDDQEIHRGGTSFTIDTVRDYAKRFPDQELFYLIGEDHVAQLPKWREAGELAQTVQFVVIPRPGSAGTSAPSGNDPFPLIRLRGFPLDLSSSQVRQRVREGRAITGLVPPAVEEAILNNRLYL